MILERYVRRRQWKHRLKWFLVSRTSETPISATMLIRFSFIVFDIDRVDIVHRVHSVRLTNDIYN